jgi:uncharacterized protein DUF4410
VKGQSKVLALTAACVVVVIGAATAAVQQPASRAITNIDIINLARSGLSESIVIETIEQSSETNFDTTPDGLINLKTAGVSDAVISAMIARKRVVPASAAAPPGAGAKPQLSEDRPAREIKSGILDEVKLYVDRPSATRVVIRPFSATDSDLVNGEKKEETKTLQTDGPRLLAERFVAKLKEIGPFADISIANGTVPADALIFEGRFIELDPGSRAKRYFAGFGAGKSAVGVRGAILTADGTTIATFEQRRIGVMGAFGGDSIGKLTSDAKSIGEDLAVFLSAWVTGKKLK